MKTVSIVILLVSLTCALCAQESNTVNFNLVQVNQYHGQEKVQDSVKTPGQRIVIDLKNPDSFRPFVKESPPGQLKAAPVVVNVAGALSGNPDGTTLPWETGTVLRAVSGADSFKVSSSRTGCPGTEVRPSVSVAFATSHGWSDPPIRFGPLTDRTMCPLGHGFTLEVSASGASPPRVKLREPSSSYSQR